jgi:hypothetical protein
VLFPLYQPTPLSNLMQWMCVFKYKQGVRCAFFDRNLHSRMPLSFTPLLCLKCCHACDQCHSSRVFTPLTGWHCKFRSNTEGPSQGMQDLNPNPEPNHQFRSNTEGPRQGMQDSNPNPEPNHQFRPNTEGPSQGMQDSNFAH